MPVERFSSFVCLSPVSIHHVTSPAVAVEASEAIKAPRYVSREPELIARLQPRFLTDLKPGTRVVSHAFRMTGWRPDASESLRVAGAHPGQGDESTLYLWIVPADVRGTWTGGGMRVRIEQNYQEVEVAGAAEATLRGVEIAWRSPLGRFRGRVQGDRMIADDGRVLTRER